MTPDTTNQFRTILENDPPRFFDRVNTPWDLVPDLEGYNKHAYFRIVRALKELTRSTAEKNGSNSQGILILGEAGTGKTHLLMRVARNLAETNHILFIRKPNNEDAVAQHIWANVVSSLAKIIPTPTKNNERSQLDDLLAHVFSTVLIPEFEQDIRDDKDADQKRRWVNRLQEDPYNLFNMLGEGEKRQDNLDRIRKRTLKYLQFNHPDVDQTIARVLITYCFVAREDRKRVLLNWLAGQDVDETEARDLGLPTSWVNLDDDSGDAATQQQREEQALRAIRTVGILSTYYQPLILAFDQLEGLRDHSRLTHKWGDVVREIFTMAPNFLVITCIFPSLWETWFLPTLDQSVSERIAQQVVTLDAFEPKDGLKLLETQLATLFVKHRLPTSIYPFEDADIEILCQKATSPRSFIQSARHEFLSWLDGNESVADGGSDTAGTTVTQSEVDEVIRVAFDRFQESLRKSFATEMLLEQDFFGRIRSLMETLFAAAGADIEMLRANCGHLVMPPNVIWRNRQHKISFCVAIMNSEGSSFAARMRNLNKCFQAQDQFTHLIIIRDRRCKKLGGKSQAHLESAQTNRASYVDATQDEMTCLNAVYDTLVAVEEHDLTVGTHEINKQQVVGFLGNQRIFNRTEFFRYAACYSPALSQILGFDGSSNHVSSPAIRIPATTTAGPGSIAPTIANRPVNPPFELQQTLPLPRVPSTPKPRSAANDPLPQSNQKGIVDIVIGDDVLDSPHVGMLGELRDGRTKLGISLTKPQCLVLLGYMGSGKSYALGVLIENALLTQPGLIEQSRPMSVVAFNYRRNPQSRFEHGGFAVPNREPTEIQILAEKYGAHPMGVKTVNIFGYHAELPRRAEEYGTLNSFPIQFRPDELGADHWEILMKPPSREAECRHPNDERR
jgi:hypothetical protein